MVAEVQSPVIRRRSEPVTITAIRALIGAASDIPDRQKAAFQAICDGQADRADRVTRTQAAALLGVSPNHLDALCRRHEALAAGRVRVSHRVTLFERVAVLSFRKGAVHAD